MSGVILSHGTMAFKEFALAHIGEILWFLMQEIFCCVLTVYIKFHRFVGHKSSLVCGMIPYPTHS
jgi:hypothetical protein